MKVQKGRKSAASLTVVSGMPCRRPEPAPGLSDSESALWREITATKPGDWWDAASVPLLTEYCRLKTSADVVADQLAEFQTEWLKTDDGVRRYKDLTAIRDKVQGRMAQLAMKMRLTQQSRYDAQKGDRIQKNQGGSGKPWERKR